jgi:dihydropteroate synthase
MPTKPPLPEVVATRCSAELLAKLDELVELLSAASPIRVKLSRSKVARAALEAGVDELLRAHRKPEGEDP